MCTKHDIMMIMDEIQCGMGRTGKKFSYMHYDFKPDIITMAKGIGNGVTVGAIATTAEIAKKHWYREIMELHLEEILLPVRLYTKQRKFLKEKILPVMQKRWANIWEKN